MTQPHRIELDHPGEFLAWLDGPPAAFTFASVEVAQIWGLVGLAALTRPEADPRWEVILDASNPAGRFAHAVGLAAARNGRHHDTDVERGRTVPIRRFRFLGDVEKMAADVSRLLVRESEHEETRLTIYYVLVELLRNVIQHSGDKLGGVVAAQRMYAGRGRYQRESIQVAVADCGMGIPASLSGIHPSALDPSVALEKALHPHISGAFAPGLSGSAENAGLGLFFISEMAKLTAGRLLIASRGASLTLSSDEDTCIATQDLLPCGFPGTLVAFELPIGEVHEFDAMIRTIQARARERTPKRVVQNWLRFETPPKGVLPLLLNMLAENTAEAREFAESVERKVVNREPVALDFRGMKTCTQSFLHALLYEALRLAWARRSEIYVVNAAPAVESGLRFLESYALGG